MSVNMIMTNVACAALGAVITHLIHKRSTRASHLEILTQWKAINISHRRAVTSLREYASKTYPLNLYFHTKCHELCNVVDETSAMLRVVLFK
jgi:hypothetical protein